MNAKMNNLIMAKLVYDGGDSVIVPSEMGTPREDQLQGTPAERLSELAGRVCYDSLGKGRPSFTYDAPTRVDPHTGEVDVETIQGYHDHIKQVGHGSVWEHFNFTVAIPAISTAERHLIAWLCCNRPGVLVLPDKDSMRVTLNLRSVIEWMRFSKEFYANAVGGRDYVGEDKWISREFCKLANQIAPHIVDDSPVIGETVHAELTEPINDHERWVSMYLTGSRGLSHELVRHGDFTAISQRSTRFVDESESPWVEHPLETKYTELEFPQSEIEKFQDQDCVQSAKATYRQHVSYLEPWLVSRNVEKTSARKQARGAARGYLGNALHTELIFSANVAQWKRMLRQRASQFADAEIRELFCKVLGELKQSRYASCFDGWELAPSPDGIGQVAIENL